MYIRELFQFRTHSFLSFFLFLRPSSPLPLLHPTLRLHHCCFSVQHSICRFSTDIFTAAASPSSTPSSPLLVLRPSSPLPFLHPTLRLHHCHFFVQHSVRFSHTSATGGPQERKIFLETLRKRARSVHYNVKCFISFHQEEDEIEEHFSLNLLPGLMLIKHCSKCKAHCHLFFLLLTRGASGYSSASVCVCVCVCVCDCLGCSPGSLCTLFFIHMDFIEHIKEMYQNGFSRKALTPEKRVDIDATVSLLYPRVQ